MKLKNELPNVVKAFKRFEKKIPAYIETIKNQGGYKDLEARIAWDLLYATKGSLWICELYSKYDCNDNHIATLAKRALREVCPIN